MQIRLLGRHQKGLLSGLGWGQGNRRSFEDLGYEYIGFDISFNSQHRNEQGRTTSSELEPVYNCDLCAGSKLETEAAVGRWKLMRCTKCGLVFTSPRYTRAVLQEIYEGLYYDGALGYLSAQLVEPSEDEYRLAKSLLKIRMPTNKNRVPRSLDIVCGAGRIVRAFKQLGWEATGIDLSNKAISAGKNLGLDLRISGIEDSSLGTFEVITVFHILEHLQSPKAFLNQCAVRLVRKGHMLIEVPNYGSRAAKKMRQTWPYLFPDLHLYQFTIDILNRYLLQADLEVVGIQKTHGRSLLQPSNEPSGGGGQNREIAKSIGLGIWNCSSKVPAFRQFVRYMVLDLLGHGEFIRVLARKKG
jgi:2-polyprenyl-3-methyl-5-hydroxy-6-metoxy-1,4-benzoquinol methylase